KNVGLESEAGVQMTPFTGPNTNTQGFIFHNNDFIIVSFRGTQIDKIGDFLADLQTDLEFFPDAEPGGGRVHHGFKKAIDDVWEGINQQLSRINQDGRGRKVWFTGHSLGAAISTLAANRFGSENAQGLYTYGSP